MAIEFLYIDDDINAQGIVKAIESEDLKFVATEPKSWNEQIEMLIDDKSLNNYDGLLLDLKLEFTKEDNQVTQIAKGLNDKTKLVKFSGADLAQAIRTKIKSDQKIHDLPIFLCSTDNKFLSYLDRTSYDLFDKKLDKNVDFKDPQKNSKIFIEFAKEYIFLNKFPSVEEIIQKAPGDSEDLNILKAELDKCKTPHEKIYLLDKYLLQPSGILIDENLLAIRLGVDMENSKNWKKFKEEKLSRFKYRGVLSNYYNRWWNYDLIAYFRDELEINLKSLSAEERVDFLSKVYNDYELKAIDKMPHQEFTTYWYKCYLSKYPIDILDGLKIMDIPRYPWLDQNYISKAYLSSEERDREKILPLLGPIEKEIFLEMD